MLRTHARRDDGWYRIENLAGADSARIYLYDEIGLWGITAADFVRELEAIDAERIDLHINSPGGDVFDGVAIYNALRNHSSTVVTYIDGLAASAASFIAQAGTPVRVARNATMMIHDASGLCYGNAEDMLAMAELLEAASDNIADIYAQRSGTVKQWRKAMRAETWYNNGAEAVEAGLADEVYEPGDSPTDRIPAKTHPVRAAAPPPEPPIPVAPADQPPSVPEQAELPESETVPPVAAELPVFDPAVFREAMAQATSAGPMPDFDPDAFRSIMASVSAAMPALPEPETPAPAPPPPIPWIDPGAFARSIKEGLL